METGGLVARMVENILIRSNERLELFTNEMTENRSVRNRRKGSTTVVLASTYAPGPERLLVRLTPRNALNSTPNRSPSGHNGARNSGSCGVRREDG